MRCAIEVIRSNRINAKKPVYDYISMYQYTINADALQRIKTGQCVYTEGIVGKTKILNGSCLLDIANDAAYSAANKEKYLVLDMDGLIPAPIDLRLTIQKIAESVRCLYIVGIQAERFDDIYESWNFGGRYTRISSTIFIGNSSDDIFKCSTKIYDIVKADVCRQLFRMTHQPESSNVPIYSSNVYANRYFNVRRLFQNENVHRFITVALFRSIIENVCALSDLDGLVCGSINGVILASNISIMLGKPVVFLKNVGPSMEVKNGIEIEKIKECGKYVYIFDFSCMSAEQQRVKLLCAVKRAKVILNVGISYYKLQMKKEATDCGDDTFTLFNINQFSREPYYIVHS